MCSMSSIRDSAISIYIYNNTLLLQDCMEDKKAYLVQLDYEETEDIQLLICSGLKELATGCKAAVKEFSACQGREHVDHLVDIHLTSISGRVCNNIG